MDIVPVIKQSIKKFSIIKLCILFGSAAKNKLSVNSDIDIAIKTEGEFKYKDKMRIIEELAIHLLRPIEIIDIDKIDVILLRQICSNCVVIYQKNQNEYYYYLKKMIFEITDFLPYYNRILEYRVNKWISS